MNENPADDYQVQLDDAIDKTLDVFEQAARDGVQLDPLATIMNRLQARGQEINLEEAPPMLRMLMSGLGVE